ncbi:MAG TPA: hypothetical protein VKU19_08520 [Bryobacteraceae bacterium]|nr:hypothetical protein [Bryobacteraceae bacterium]
MRLDTMKRHTLLLAALVWCPFAMADVRLKVTTVPSLPEIREATAIIEETRALAMRQTRDSWESELLRAAERSFAQAVSAPVGPLLGMATTHTNDGDVLVAQWEPGAAASAGVLGISMWDTPDYSWFMLKCDPVELESYSSTQVILKKLLKWPLPLPEPLVLVGSYGLGNSGTFFAAAASLPHLERGLEYRLFAVRSSAGSYVLLKLGKGLFLLNYPEGGVYVPERFPPLRQVIATWPKEAVFAEVGKIWAKSSAYATNNVRDKILILQAAQSGFSDSDLRSLMLPANVPGDVAWSQRASAVMDALIKTQQVDKYHDVIEEVTLQIGSREDSGEFAAKVVFDALRMAATGDYSSLALKCVAKCIYVDAPLRYLVDRGATESVYSQLDRAIVPQNSEWLRRQALDKIRERIGKARLAR